jgi:hypothetical protein
MPDKVFPFFRRRIVQKPAQGRFFVFDAASARVVEYRNKCLNAEEFFNG